MDGFAKTDEMGVQENYCTCKKLSPRDHQQHHIRNALAGIQLERKKIAKSILVMADCTPSLVQRERKEIAQALVSMADYMKRIQESLDDKE